MTKEQILLDAMRSAVVADAIRAHNQDDFAAVAQQYEDQALFLLSMVKP